MYMHIYENVYVCMYCEDRKAVILDKRSLVYSYDCNILNTHKVKNKYD